MTCVGRNSFQLFSAMAVALLFLATGPSPSRAQAFSFDFETWSGSGNGFGTPGVTDDFDGVSLDGWSIEQGTAIEASGVLNLRDPGTLTTVHLPTFDFSSFSSHVVRDDGTFIADGLGDFTLTTVVKQTVIPLDQFVGLDFGTAAPHHFVQVSIQNWGPELGAHAAFEPGLNAVLGVFVIGTLLPVDFYVDSFSTVHVPIAPAAITGDIWLRLDFVDATDQITGSISTDGGSSFTTIGTLPMPVTGWGGQAGLLADPRQLAAPSVLTLGPLGMATLIGLMGLGLAGLGVRRRAASAAN